MDSLFGTAEPGRGPRNLTDFVAMRDIVSGFTSHGFRSFLHWRFRHRSLEDVMGEQRDLSKVVNDVLLGKFETPYLVAQPEWNCPDGLGRHLIETFSMDCPRDRSVSVVFLNHLREVVNALDGVKPKQRPLVAEPFVNVLAAVLVGGNRTVN